MQCRMQIAMERASGRFDRIPFRSVHDRIVRPSDFQPNRSAGLITVGRGPECPCNPAISVPNAFRSKFRRSLPKTTTNFQFEI